MFWELKSRRQESTLHFKVLQGVGNDTSSVCNVPGSRRRRGVPLPWATPCLEARLPVTLSCSWRWGSTVGRGWTMCPKVWFGRGLR